MTLVAVGHEELAALDSDNIRQLSVNTDRHDYRCVLLEQGVTQQYITRITENVEDQIQAPDKQAPYLIGVSAIHGQGVFVTADLAEGAQVAVMRVGVKRTPAGRYANHSKHPNCEVAVLPNGDFALIARSTLVKGDEATVNYRQVIALKETL